MPKKRQGPKAEGGREGAEYRFRIDAFTPATMPMKRLAEYMAELAAMLGEPGAVHLMQVEEGSTVPVIRVDFEAIPKVRDRVAGVARGDAENDAILPFRRLNRLLREDNATAVLREPRRNTPVLKFPGRDEKQDLSTTIRQHGSVDGKLVRIGGKDETIHATLSTEGQTVGKIHMTEMVAKRLATKLFEYVRLIGVGRWRRAGDGTWSLEEFKVEDFESLQVTPLSGVLKDIRAIGTGFETPDAFGELKRLRHGPGGDADAMH